MANMLLTKALEKVSTSLGTMKYIGRKPIREYVDNKATDNIIGYRYELVLPSMGYAQISVKIPGAAQLDEPTEPRDVVLSGLQIVPYARNNSVEISCKADGIKAAR